MASYCADSRSNRVATAGWKTTSSKNTLDLAKSFEDCGVDAIIFTDIDRDGLMKGLNSDATKRLSDNVSIPVIGSGGINGPENLENVKKYSELRRDYRWKSFIYWSFKN